MIIWGTRGMNSRVESGTFHCPRCGPDRPYDIVCVNRWFTLYFIPIIPLGEAGRYLECKNCAATFDESVKSHDPTVENAKFRASFEVAMLRAMLIMAQADGVAEDCELECIAEIMTQLSGRAFEIDEVQAEVRACSNQTLGGVLREVTSSLNDNGKAMVLKGLLTIASADGQVTEQEATAMYDAGKVLGIRRSDMKSILKSLES